MARLQKDDTNSSKESYQNYTVLANTSINIQPGGAEDALLAGTDFGQTYVAFTTASGILSADKLTDIKTGEVFIVKGRSSWLSPSLIPHLELLLIKFETTE